MQRFYLETVDINTNFFWIEDSEIFNQMIKVLRYKINNELIFFNGKDYFDFLFIIKKIENKKIFFEKKGQIESNTEIDFTLNLYNALPNKFEKIEYIIQKGTEIGISNFIFFKSNRSQKIMISENKFNRLKKIIIESTEQSGRNIIPQISIIEKINFINLTNDFNIFFDINKANSTNIKNIKINYGKKINIFVGPEGGFDDLEIKNFKNFNFIETSLGKRVLRTETVGVVTSFFIISNK